MTDYRTEPEPQTVLDELKMTLGDQIQGLKQVKHMDMAMPVRCTVNQTIEKLEGVLDTVNQFTLDE